jgi:chaperonin cofactor prefoldin
MNIKEELKQRLEDIPGKINAIDNQIEEYAKITKHLKELEDEGEIEDYFGFSHTCHIDPVDSKT